MQAFVRAIDMLESLNRAVATPGFSIMKEFNKPSNMIAFEFFAWTPAPEWGGKKVRIPLEDDAIVTERGVEWLAAVNERILLIRN